MRYRSQWIAYPYFVVAMLLFGLQMVFGLLAAAKYLGPDPLRIVHDWLSAVNAGDVEGALALTAHGRDTATPNPNVGCVIVSKGGGIIGRGVGRADQLGRAAEVSMKLSACGQGLPVDADHGRPPPDHWHFRRPVPDARRASWRCGPRERCLLARP